MSEERDLDDAYEDDLETPEPSDTDEDPGSEDDLPEDDLDEEDGGEPEPVEAQTRQPSRGESRQQRLSSENARLRAELEEIRRGQTSDQQRRQSEDFQRQERERLEQMSPEERIEYRVNQRVSQIEFNSWNTNDRVLFDGMVRDNPAVAQIKDEVETLFQQRVRDGQPVDRSTIAIYLIGQKAIAKAPRARAAGKRAEQAGRERNTVRPSSGRSDAAPGGRSRANEQEARRKRLEDMEI